MRIPSVAARVILVETPLIRGATAAQIASLRNTIFIEYSFVNVRSAPRDDNGGWWYGKYGKSPQKAGTT
jgi:hypothetical protein